MKLVKLSLLYWFLFAVLLGHIWLLYGDDGMAPDVWQSIRIPFGLSLCATALAVLLLACRYSVILLFLQDEQRKSAQVDALLPDLDSPDISRQRRAVAILASLLNEPFGPIRPLAADDKHIEMQAALYKVWFQLQKAIQAAGDDSSDAAVTARPTTALRALAKESFTVEPEKPEPAQPVAPVGCLEVPVFQADETVSPKPAAHIYPPDPPPLALPSTLTQNLVERIRSDSPTSLERLGNVIKDVLIDWDILGDEDDDEYFVDELPAMSPEAFVLKMRVKVEETLFRVADAINQAPTGDIIVASEEKICQHLAELVSAAVVLGVQMRLEEAEALCPPGHRPQGEWARRLRRMLAGGAGMPLASGNRAAQP